MDENAAKDMEENGVPNNNNNNDTNSYAPAKTGGGLDFTKDDPKDMTRGRRIALYMMHKYAWYNPRLADHADKHQGDDIVDGGRFRSQDGYPISHSKEETPSLEKAWIYFEHTAMPRYLYVEKDAPNEKKSLLTRIVRKFSKADKQLTRAEPGEDGQPTRLYHPLWTPHKQLGDFGLGIGLYFSTIRALTVLVFILGIIHIPNFMHFSGPDYSDNQEGVDLLLKGSAVCTDTKWVACPTCNETQFKRFGYNFVREPETDNAYVLTNNCDNGVTLVTGFVNYAGLWYTVLAALYLCYYLKNMEVAYDEDEQTAVRIFPRF